MRSDPYLVCLLRCLVDEEQPAIFPVNLEFQHEAVVSECDQSNRWHCKGLEKLP